MPLFEEAIAFAREQGDDFPRLYGLLDSRAQALSDWGRHDEAISSAREAWEGRLRISGEESHSTIYSGAVLGDCMCRAEDPEGRDRLESSLETAREFLGADHRTTAKILHWFGACLFLLGEKEAAVTVLIEAKDAMADLYGIDDRRTKSVDEELRAMMNDR